MVLTLTRIPRLELSYPLLERPDVFALDMRTRSRLCGKTFVTRLETV